MLRSATTTVLAFAASASGTKYIADLGDYGEFELEVSSDDGTMEWKSDLKNIDVLGQKLGLDLTALNYHLHQQWTNMDSDYAIGGDGCGPAVTGGHYDPFFACGPASGQPRDMCDAIGKPRSANRYACSGAYANFEYAKCEVGDLSGKDGALVITDGEVHKESLKDPLAVIDTQFQSDVVEAPPENFASIVFHDGSPRVLCGRLFLADSRPPAPTTCMITGYELWDQNGIVDSNFEDSQSPICNDSLTEGYTIKAVASGCDEVEFELTASDADYEHGQTERVVPYYLFGDDRGNARFRTLREGDYVLSVYGDGEMADTFKFEVMDKC